MVSLRQIPFTIADNDLALLNKTYLKNIDSRVTVSFPQLSGWAVRKTSPQLLQKANTWLNDITNDGFYDALHYKYYTKNEYFTDKKIALFNGRNISPYDHLFRKYSGSISWDWHLLASMAYYESTFDTTSVSPRGAVGLMQLMPETANMTPEELMNPEENIKAAIDYIKVLNRIFGQIENEEERAKFIMASYNVGQGHVIDAMKLAEKYGKDKYAWDDNVETYLRLKADSGYYNDPICKNGFCRGEDVGDYVKNVFIRYQRYLNTGIK
jgi:membrane-bound lytic murein transglycosylase F